MLTPMITFHILLEKSLFPKHQYWSPLKAQTLLTILDNGAE